MTETPVEDAEEPVDLEELQKQLKGSTRKALFDRSETIRREIDKLRRDITALKETRGSYNQEARELRAKRDAAIGVSSGDFEDLRSQAELNKSLRDKANTQIQLLKKEREQLTEQIKLEWASVRQARDSFQELRSEVGPVPDQINEEIERLEWKQQTTPHLSIEEENALIEHITDLYAKVVAATSLDEAYERTQDIVTRAKETLAKREEIHEQIVQLAEQSQKNHEAMIQTYQTMDELRKEGTEHHEEYLRARKNADAVHQEIVTLQERMSTIRQEIDLIAEELDLRRRQKVQEKTAQDREVVEKKVSTGSRITLDELRLLMESEQK